MWIRDRIFKKYEHLVTDYFLGESQPLQKSDVIWLFNKCKKKTPVFLNIIHGTIQQLTENNESESVILSSSDFMALEFKSWSMKISSW